MQFIKNDIELCRQAYQEQPQLIDALFARNGGQLDIALEKHLTDTHDLLLKRIDSDYSGLAVGYTGMKESWRSVLDRTKIILGKQTISMRDRRALRMSLRILQIDRRRMAAWHLLPADQRPGRQLFVGKVRLPQLTPKGEAW